MQAHHLGRAFLAMAMAASSGALAGPYSDLWFDPAAPGWGVNVVQQDDTAFVTLFVYRPDGDPDWYVASDASIVAYGAGGPVFAGRLYRTRGPQHGPPLHPGPVTAAPVGAISLEVLAADRLRLHYDTGGATMVRELARQTWRESSIGGYYAWQVVVRQAAPGEPVRGVRRYQAHGWLGLQDGRGYLRLDAAEGHRCEFEGPYAQSGKLGRFTGRFTCSGAALREGIFELGQIEVSMHGITGSLRMESGALREWGRFAAVAY